MKRFLFLVAFIVFYAMPANAQQQPQALIVAVCGTPPISYVAGTYGILTMDTTGKLCGSSSGGGGGTQNVNLTQILGAAVSATNPLYVAPATSVNPWPISAASLPLPAGAATQTTLAAILAVQGAAPAQQTGAVVGQVSQYPSGATPITASATGTTTATTATLAGTSGKTTYICGYSIRANATAATTVTDTITGTITGTLSSILWVAPLASGLGVDEQIFSPCVPASATNTGIAIVSGAPGAGGTVSSKGWGYQL